MASARPAVGCRSAAVVCLALLHAALAGCGGAAPEPLSPADALRQKLRESVSVAAADERVRDVLLRRLAVGEGLKRRPSQRREALRCLIRAAQEDPTLKALKELARDPTPEIRAAAREALEAAGH